MKELNDQNPEKRLSGVIEENFNASTDFLYEYAYQKVNSLYSNMHTLDVKSSVLMQFLGVMFGLIFIANFYNKLENGYGVIILFSFMVFVLVSLIFSILALYVKKPINFPTVKSIVDYSIENNINISESELKQKLIVNAINAEKSLKPIIDYKAKQLLRAQIFMFLSIIFLILCSLFVIVK